MLRADDIIMMHREAFDQLWGWREIGPANYDMSPAPLARTGDKPPRWMKAEGGVAFVSKPMCSANMVTEAR